MSWDSLIWFGFVVISYLIGGIPTAYVATQLLIDRDIRQLGDRNSGAANVFRNVSPKAGLAVGAIDILKGVVAVVLVQSLVDSTALAMTAGVAVLAGHNWPVHLGLRGGRGAATAIGVLFAMLPAVAIPVGAVALIILYFTKNAIKGLGVVLISVPILAWPVGYSYPIAIYALAIPLMVGLTHYLSVRSRTADVTLDLEPADEQALRQR